MNFGRQFFLTFITIVLGAIVLTAQTSVLIDQYPNVDRIDAGTSTGQEIIFLEPSTGNFITATVVNRDSVHVYVSTDDGANWIKSPYIDGTDEEVRSISVGGTAQKPVVVYSNRGSTPSAAPWARHLAYIAQDDLGWGGNGFSTSPILTAGTQTDVLDAYYAAYDVSSFDNNYQGICALHGSSQEGGEYYQFYATTDGGANWSDRIRIFSASDDDATSGFYVNDLATASTPDFHYGPNNNVLAVVRAEKDTDDLRMVYTQSTDGGLTWGDVSLIPGAEEIIIDNGDTDRGYEVIVDQEGNYHVFVLGLTNDEWGIYDFKLTGTTWSSTKILVSEFGPNGLIAVEDDHGDTGPFVAPTLNSDGSMFLSYIDLKDTTGGENDYSMFTVFSTDNGSTWSEPKEIINDPLFNAAEIHDVARNANGSLHITYSTVTNDTTQGVEIISRYYSNVPIDNITSVDESEVLVPDFALSQNYPNPFNPTTNIRYSIGGVSQVKISIFNIMGQEVKTLVNKNQGKGNYSVSWNGKNNGDKKVSAGLYFYTLEAGNFIQTRKMILLK